MDNKVLVSILFVACLVNISDSQIFQATVPIQDIAVSSDYVYVADSHVLHLLLTNLTHISSLTMRASGVSEIALNSDATFIVVCFLDGFCKPYEIQTLLETNSVHFHTSPTATVPTDKRKALGALSNSTFYVGCEGYTSSTGQRAIILRQFQFDWSVAYQLRTFEALITNSSFVSREFHNVLKEDKYIYYIAVDTIGDENRLTVMRVCDDVNGEHFSAVSEVKLDCGIITPFFDITYSSLLPDINQANKSLVITTSSTNGSQVCIYPIVDIDRELQRVYLECVSTNNKLSLPWTNYEYTENCSAFDEV